MSDATTVLIAGLILFIIGIAREDTQLKLFGNEIKMPHIPSRRIRLTSSIFGILLMVFSMFLFVLLVPNKSSTIAGTNSEKTIPSIVSFLLRSTSVRYDFETGVTGWAPQDYKDSLACTNVSQSKEHAKEGQYSLMMSMALRGSDSEKSKGEAWIDMQHNPPIDVTVPVDLKSQTITAWVYAPSGAKGEKNSPNGLQLFVKDNKWRSLYGTWKNVTEDSWFQVTLTVDDKKPSGGWIDNGFDPGRIVAVGLKMGTGDSSKAQYDGPIYVDDINW